MNTKVINLDINDKLYDNIYAKQGDVKSRFLKFNLTDSSAGSSAFDLTGKNVRAYAVRPDEEISFVDLTIEDAKKGICILELTTQMLLMPGKVKMELLIYEGEARYSSIPFEISVLKSVNDDDAIESASEFRSLDEALKKVNNIDNKADKKDVDNLSSQLETIANKGTTVEVLERVTKDEIERQVADGTIANLTIKDNSVTIEKMKFINKAYQDNNLINIMPKNLSMKGDFYSPDDGKLYNTSGTQGYKNTGKIYIKSKKIKTKGVVHILFYNENDVFLSAIRINGDNNLINVIQDIDVPDNTSYIIANITTIFWWDSDNAGRNYECFIFEVKENLVIDSLISSSEEVCNSYYLPKQLFDKDKISVVNSKLNTVSGELEIDSTNQWKHIMIPIKSVNYNVFGIRDILYFDENEKFLRLSVSYTSDSQLATVQTIKPPTNARYIGCNILKYYWERAEVFELESGDICNKLINSYESSKIDGINKYSGKTILNFGDSIFGNFKAPGDISTIISHNLNCNSINMGFGGNRMASHLQNSDFKKFSFWNLLDSIVSNDFTLQESSLSASGIPAYYSDRINTLKNINWNEVEMITIAYGTNDWNGANPIDDNSNPKNTDTFKGAFRYSLEKLWGKYPHLKVVICTPIYRFKEDLSKDSDDWTMNINGELIKLTDFVQACKDIGKEYKIKVIDNYNELGINKFNRFNYFNSVDGTHPIYNGRKLIADNISSNI